MTLDELSRAVPGLATMNHVDKIKHFAWFLVTQDKVERFGVADIRRCYDQLHYAQASNFSQLIQQMADKNPPDVLKDSHGFRLEGRIREKLDGLYGTRPATIAVDEMLQSLVGKVSDEAERLFLSEALDCFRIKAFRATIVMTWNVAFDHLLNWVFANHLATFNASISRRYPRKAGIVVTAKDDFLELKESETIEVCAHAGIVNDNLAKVLREKLTRRNLAAHPSLVEIVQYQAEDVISDLVNNVILRLT
jgi:hypothetical protein